MANKNVWRESTVVARLSLLVLVALLVVGQTSAQMHSDRWRGRFGFGLHRKPALSIYYGFAQSSLTGLTQSLADPRFLEIKLGGTSEDVESEEYSVVSYHYNYFSLVNISNELGPKVVAETPPIRSKITSDLWRLGIAWEKGYGYSLGDSLTYRSILLYHSQGMNWSRLSVKNAVVLPADIDLLNLYTGTFRFGTKTEGGIKLRLVPLVILDAGFERAIVFRRHLFWRWAGSTILEGLVDLGLDHFINRVLDSSPAAVPVVNFVLKNAFSYGAYQLRRDKMNYPFDSEAPLLYDTFKVGLTFVF